MKEKKEKDIKYPVRCFRLEDKTFEELKKARDESNLSWNLYFAKLLKTKKND